MSASRAAWILAALSTACAGPARPAAPSAPWSYEVTVEQGGAELGIEALFPPGDELHLSVPPAARGFVEAVLAGDDAHELERTDGVWILPSSARARPLRWRFHARAAARELGDTDVAAWRGRGFFGSLSAFLLHDDDAAEGARIVLRARGSDGSAFACACARVAGEATAWTAPAADLALLPACAFGAISSVRLAPLEDQELDLTLVRMEPGDGPPPDELLAWVVGAARAVQSYERRFPVAHLLLILVPRRHDGLGDGQTRGYGGATISIAVGPRTGAPDFQRDWVLVHEMIHLGLPSLPRPQHWLEEGSATYLEPLLRARAGLRSEDEVWGEILDDFPQGVPGPRDSGLDHDRGWGRTYYGGAIFCLLADVEIRARTGNARSLQDALAAVVLAGGNVTMDGKLELVLELGDRATGTSVLAELYQRMGDAPEPRELDSTFERLGVALVDGRVVYDDAAPLADVRRSLVLGRP